MGFNPSIAGCFGGSAVGCDAEPLLVVLAVVLVMVVIIVFPWND